MKLQITCKVENGEVVSNKKTLANAFKEIEGWIVVSIEKKKKKRSNPQNRYYWGVVIPILRMAFKEHWGEVRSMDEIHQWAKVQFNYTEKVNIDSGEAVKIPKSTSLNSTTEQEEYHEEIRRFAEEWFNTKIPLPGEKMELEL